MSEEVVVKVESEVPEVVADTAEATADVVIDKALEIAEIIVEAKEEGVDALEEVQEIKYSLDDIYVMLVGLNQEIQILKDLNMGLSDQVAELSALEVAEVVVENTPAEVAEVVADVEPPKEVVETAVTPQIRQKKKAKWL